MSQATIEQLHHAGRGRIPPGWSDVRSICIAGEHWDPAALRRLAASAHVTELRLFGAAIGDDGLRAIAGGFAGLRALAVAFDGVTAAGVRALARAPFWGGLERLHLYKNALGDAGVVALAELEPAAGALTELNVCHNGLSCAVASVLGRWGRRLRVLHAGINALGDAGVQKLAAALDAPGVVELNLKSNGVGERGFAALLETPGLARLEALLVENNPLGPTAGEGLARGGWPLRRLQLEETALGDAGVVALSRRAAWPVARVHLSSNGIGDRGLAELLAGPWLAAARQVDVRDNAWGPAGGRDLARWQRAHPTVDVLV